MPEDEPVSRWHIEAYDPDIDDPPAPGEHDCIGEHDPAEAPLDVDADVDVDLDVDLNGGGDGT